MNLTARTPSFVSSSASANPAKSSYGYQDPEQPVLDDRAGKPEQNSWDSLERVDPHREEHLLGRTAHSARNEETMHEDMKILGNLFQVTIYRGNLSNRHHQVIQKRIMVDLGLLKSGKVELRSTIDHGNLRKFLGIYCTKLTLIVRNLFSAEMRIPQGRER